MAQKFTIQLGTDYRLILQLKQPDGNPMSLAGYLGRAEIRTRPGTIEPPEAEFVIDFDTLGDRANGKLALILDRAGMIGLRGGREYSFNLLLEDASGLRDEYLDGTLQIDEAVTQWM